MPASTNLFRLSFHTSTYIRDCACQGDRVLLPQLAIKLFDDCVYNSALPNLQYHIPEHKHIAPHSLRKPSCSVGLPSLPVPPDNIPHNNRSDQHFTSLSLESRFLSLSTPTNNDTADAYLHRRSQSCRPTCEIDRPWWHVVCYPAAHIAALSPQAHMHTFPSPSALRVLSPALFVLQVVGP